MIGGRDLEPVADDALVVKQAFDSLLGEAGDLLGIEVGERPAIGFALSQHDEPAQPGLGTFEREELELLAIVVDRHAPLLVVVRGHQLAAARAPIATWFSVSSP